MKRAPVVWSIALAAVAACGGQSVRFEGDDSSSGGEPVEPPDPNGGRSGIGGTTGAAPTTGGNGTSGTFDGGGVSFGGSMPVGGTGIGGTGIAGTGAAGQGGVAGRCSDEPRPGLPARDAPLAWGPDGAFIWSSSAFGLQGSWYSVDDCTNAPLGTPCTERNPALLGPDGRYGWATSRVDVCSSGVAPQVGIGPDGRPAYSVQWGYLAGMTLNEGRSWDSTFYCVEGFELDITGSAPATLRVLLPTTFTQDSQHFIEVAVPAVNVSLPLSAFAQGSWVASPTPLDRTDLVGLQFQVFTDEFAPKPFEFCVSNIRMIYSTVPKAGG